jgi:hypothetical protein
MQQVVLDPNWDNKAVIIDCSQSKKRKQEELENYAAYAVKRKEKEEKYGEIYEQNPPAGTVQIDISKLGRVYSIVPHIQLKADKSPISKLRPSVIGELKQPVLGATVVNVKNYKNHLTDPEYVSVQHQKVIGMIKQWKMLVLDIIKEMEDEWEFSFFAFKEQHDWAKTQLDPVVMGLSKFKLVSVGLLNINAVIQLVDGVENEEMADFVINLSTCRSCEIALLRHDELNNCSIVTIFNENNKRKVAYGKKEIKDYNLRKHKDKKSRYIMK